jgi:hypothetical protein
MRPAGRPRRAAPRQHHRAGMARTGTPTRLQRPARPPGAHDSQHQPSRLGRAPVRTRDPRRRAADPGRTTDPRSGRPAARTAAARPAPGDPLPGVRTPLSGRPRALLQHALHRVPGGLLMGDQRCSSTDRIGGVTYQCERPAGHRGWHDHPDSPVRWGNPIKAGASHEVFAEWADHVEDLAAESRQRSGGGECSGCGRIMSWREAWEQGRCNDCMTDGRG